VTDPNGAFPNIEIRDTLAGRLPYIRDTRLGVWHIAALEDCYGPDATRMAEHFGISSALAAEALAYIDSHRDEFDEIRRENDSYDFERARKILPTLKRYEVDISADNA
jgi:uncharacterized protein (DUF433 family)